MSQSPHGELMTRISLRELTGVTFCGEGGKEWFGLVAEQQKPMSLYSNCPSSLESKKGIIGGFVHLSK